MKHKQRYELKSKKNYLILFLFDKLVYNFDEDESKISIELVACSNGD